MSWFYILIRFCFFVSYLYYQYLLVICLFRLFCLNSLNIKLFFFFFEWAKKFLKNEKKKSKIWNINPQTVIEKRVKNSNNDPIYGWNWFISFNPGNLGQEMIKWSFCVLYSNVLIYLFLHPKNLFASLLVPNKRKFLEVSNSTIIEWVMIKLVIILEF